MGGEGYGSLRWDRSISLDDVSHDTAGGLYTGGKWGDVEKGDLLSSLAALADEDGGLDGSTESDSLIWVDGFVEGLVVEEVDKLGLELWDSGGTADENDLVDVTFGDAGVLQDLLNDIHAVVDEIHNELLELGSGDVGVVVFTLGESFTSERGLVDFGEENLRCLALSLKFSKSFLVLRNVDTTLLLKVVLAEIEQLLVEVFSAQMGVAVGGLDFEDTLLNADDGDVQGTTAEIEDHDVLL